MLDEGPSRKKPRVKTVPQPTNYGFDLPGVLGLSRGAVGGSPKRARDIGIEEPKQPHDDRHEHCESTGGGSHAIGRAQKEPGKEGRQSSRDCDASDPECGVCHWLSGHHRTGCKLTSIVLQGPLVERCNFRRVIPRAQLLFIGPFSGKIQRLGTVRPAGVQWYSIAGLAA